MSRRKSASTRYTEQCWKIFDDVGRGILFLGGVRGRHQNRKGCGTGLFWVFALFFYLVLGGNSDDAPDIPQKQPSPPPPIIEQISDWGIKDTVSASIAMEYCGIEDLREYTVSNASGSRSYQVAYDDEKTISVGVQDGTLSYIRVNGIDIYTESSGMIMSVDDVRT